jgi:DNA-binding NarL/FixJ family response regulator
MTGRRVVIADDLAPVLGAITAILKGSFDIVGTANDGTTAFESILSLEPDLALLDISMPGMSGIEVARALKKHGSKTRIVFLTVHEDPDIVATCLAAGGLGYVAKVRMDSDLIPAMNEALAGRLFVSRFSYEPNTL